MTRLVDPIGPPCGDHQTELSVALERASDVQACGAKAMNLARMLRAGLPVPPGFVLTAGALDAFIAAGTLRTRLAEIERRLAIGDPADAAAAEAQVEALFASTPLPAIVSDALQRARRQLSPPLAVRSSAAGEDGEFASYAGLLCSTLGVEGTDALEQALKRTWASRWTVRAARYRRGLVVNAPRVAVIVQSQIEARCAGVLFTRSPLAGRGGEMLCEYCSGTAERLVAGAITPASLCIARDSLSVCDRGELPGAEAIAPAALASLASCALAAERLFGGPQDIEWAIDRADCVWLVQSRPITATAHASRGRVVWSNANVNENFPAPISPLLYSIAAPGYTHYFRNLGRAFGLSRRRLERMTPDFRLIIGVHGGRMYYNLSAIHSILRQAPCGERLVAWFDDFTGASVDADHAESCAGSPQEAAADSGNPGMRFAPCGLRKLRRPRQRNLLGDVRELAWIGIRTAWQYVFISRRVIAFERRIDAFALRTHPQRLSRKSLIELRDDLRAFLDIRLDRWTDAALADAAAMVCYGMLSAAVARSFPDAADAHLHNSLLKGITGLKSAEPVAALWALAQAVRSDEALRALFAECDSARAAECLAADPRFAAFNARFQDYLQRWGFRCSGELMLTVPSFQERPAELLEIVRAYANRPLVDPDAQLDAQRTSRENITAHALARAKKRRVAAWLPWPHAATVLECSIRMTQAAIGLRERARYKQALLYSRLRRVALTAGHQLAQRGALGVPDDVFFLAIGELDDLLSGAAMYPGETRALVELRKTAHGRFERQSLADVLITAPGDYKTVSQGRSATGTGASPTLKGMSVCGGIARGRAKVLTHVAQSAELHPGDILVTRQTDPGWAPVFGAIAGLVLERGGMLSHGAILAREYGIPTVVGIAGAVDRIVSGTPIEVDGDCGDVRLLA